jgi:hypothetical protein
MQRQAQIFWNFKCTLISNGQMKKVTVKLFQVPIACCLMFQELEGIDNVEAEKFYIVVGSICFVMF